jgi:hypothetical protein
MYWLSAFYFDCLTTKHSAESLMAKTTRAQASMPPKGSSDHHHAKFTPVVHRPKDLTVRLSSRTTVFGHMTLLVFFYRHTLHSVRKHIGSHNLVLVSRRCWFQIGLATYCVLVLPGDDEDRFAIVFLRHSPKMPAQLLDSLRREILHMVEHA